MRSAEPIEHGLTPSMDGLGARTLALRPSIRRRLRRRALDPFLRMDSLRWRNTTRGLRLFVRASFSGLEPERLPEAADDHLVSALFVFGAIGLASDLTGMSPHARRRIELGFLRRAYGVGRLSARQLRRTLHTRAATAAGRITVREGRCALAEWFHGLDPSARLRRQIERMPGLHLRIQRRRPARVRASRRPLVARVRAPIG